MVDNTYMLTKFSSMALQVVICPYYETCPKIINQDPNTLILSLLASFVTIPTANSSSTDLYGSHPNVFITDYRYSVCFLGLNT
jgi:hypothetical protein